MKKDRQAGSPQWTETELDQLVEEATVDCYDGTVNLYIFDPTDPIIFIIVNGMIHVLLNSRIL